MKDPLTADEVRHLEHRCAVLASFIDVLGDPTFSSASGLTKEGRIFRGCMDGAIATCRALCERFGLTMNSSSWRAALKPCPTSFKKRAKWILPNAADSSCEALWDVLTAANRCVCHLENKLLDHNVRPQILRVAVDLVEDIIHAKLTEAHLSNHSLWPAASSAAWLILFSSDANLLLRFAQSL